MRSSRLTLVLPLLAVAACGGDAVLKCESGGAYLAATEMPRVRAPEDLDDLDPLREIPLPEVSPQAERPADSGCLEAPPIIVED